jgi:glutathione S-transferase
MMSKGFPNPARIRIALAEKGLTHAVEFVTVDVPTDEHKRPDFLAPNPAGTVPVITAYADLAYADIARIEVPVDLVRLKAWRARVAEHPGVAHA